MNPIRWTRNRSTACYLRRSLRAVSTSSAGSRRVPAEWLRQMIEDGAEPPRLYAWTLANLPNNEPGPQSQSSPGVGDNTSSSDDDKRRIYVLGVGNLGRLFASSLAKDNTSDRPPITLVVHRRELLEHWSSDPGIEMVRDGIPDRTTAFDIEWWTDAAPSRGPVGEPANGAHVRNLIVATKAPQALPQVDRLRRYLGPASAVAFAQNGVCKLWPPLGDAYVDARFPAGASPAWLACVTMHGVTALGPFRSLHAAPADVILGTVRPGAPAADAQAAYLAERIARAPGLAARRVPRKELWVAQLEKLVVNSVINPLTAVLRCKNGELFAEREGDGLGQVMDELLREASGTLRVLVMHRSSEGILLDGEVSGEDKSAEESLRQTRDELLERFSFPRLRAMLYAAGAKVAGNTSSMLQDVRANKSTEIGDFNGWLVDTARFLGDERGLPTHEKLISLVQARATRERGELSKELRDLR